MITDWEFYIDVIKDRLSELEILFAEVKYFTEGLEEQLKTYEEISNLPEVTKLKNNLDDIESRLANNNNIIIELEDKFKLES